jgi:hypothetical protein
MTDVQPASKGPARGYSWAPFQAGHELSVRHGGYSAARIGERAELVAQELLELAPHLAAPEFALAVSSYAMCRARVELLSAAIEEAVKARGAIKLGARIIEAATAASREEAQQRRTLGLDPMSLAELRAVSSVADLNEGLLSQLVPELPGAIAEALAAIGAGEQIEVFKASFVAALRRGPAGEE